MVISSHHRPSIWIIFIFISSLKITHLTALGIASTVSVTYGAVNTICGIQANNKSPNSIQCFTDGQIIQLIPTNISFSSISGGHDFLCGLTLDGSTLHCWNVVNTVSSTTTTPAVQTLYTNTTSPLTSLSVGKSRICALLVSTGTVKCWKRDRNHHQHHHQVSSHRHRRHNPLGFPKEGSEFETITSGDGFSCGIVKGLKYVQCWGENGIGDFIESEFGDRKMMTLVAGESHVCGLSLEEAGLLVCKGRNETGQLNVPSQRSGGEYRFSSVALGANHTCAVERKDKSVICWGGGGGQQHVMALVVASFEFELLVAGLDFTCGLTTGLSVICWGPGWPTKSSFSLSEIPLEKVIPGPCVVNINDTQCGSCGLFQNSTSLCFGENMNICKPWCDDLSPPTPPPPPMMLMTPSPSPQPNPPPTTTIHPPQSQSISPSKSEPDPEFETRWGYEMFATSGILLLSLLALVFLIRSKTQPTNKQPTTKALDPIPSNTCLVNSTSRPSTAPNSRSSSITFTTNRSLSSCSSSLYLPTRADKYTFESLALSTQNFSGDNIIGHGSFGTVYRGRLSDGRPVAVKREVELIQLNKHNNDDSSSFDSELELLSRLHHKHLVGLVGYCQEQQERLLVYEYMSNGSLHEHLHTNKSNYIYSWKTRFKIVLDAARGLDYLHSYAVPPIIHRDIKSSNILLDSNWIARVSDFGLSLESSSLPSSSPTVGTVGYIDPEYYVLKVLTTKSDVYGFGVVLLEILTGKKAVFRRSDDDCESGGGNVVEGLVEYVTPYIVRGEVWKVLDRRVGYPRLNEAEAVEVVAATALKCVKLEGKDRPSMSDVVTYLEKAYSM